MREEMNELGRQVTALQEAQRYAEALPLAERQLEVRTEHQGHDHADVVIAREDLALILEETGDKVRAASLHRDNIKVREKVFGYYHIDVSKTLNSLGLLLMDQGEYQAAQPLFERSLAIREKALGPDDLMVAKSLNNLAVLVNYMGDHRRSRQYFERSLAIKEKVFGADHPSLARALENLAALIFVQGDYDAARPLLERSLALFEQTHGPNHADVGQVLNKLAILHHTLGDYTVAQPLYERSLAIQEAQQNVLLTANTLNGLASVMVAQGDYAGAQPLYQRSLALFEEEFGPEHPHVATTTTNLASLLRERGDLVNTRRLYERALTIQERSLGPHHMTVGHTLSSLAGLLTDLGDYTTAVSLYGRALEIRETALGPDHAETGRSLNNLAALYVRQSRYDEARPLLERALAIRTQALGPDHIDVAVSLSNLGALHRQRGDYDAALPVYERSLAIREQALGPDHPDTAVSLNSLASLKTARAEYAAAFPLYQRILAIREAAYGPEHRLVAGALESLARWYLKQGRDNEARPLFQRALTIREADFELFESLSEREALAFIAKSRVSLDGWLGAFDGPTDSREAWSTTLRWKGVVTRQIRNRSSGAVDDPKVHALTERLGDMRMALARASLADDDHRETTLRREQQVELTHKKEELERQLAAASSSWQGEREIEQAGAEEVCGALDAGTALVDFLRYNNKYLAFTVVAPDCEVKRVELGAAAELEEALTGWRGVLAEPGDSDWRVDGRGKRVRQLLWDPVAPTIEGAARAIIVPDGALSSVPFGALPMEGEHYLIEDLPITYLENAQDLLRPASNVATSGALLVGDVDFGGDAAGMGSGRASRSAPCVDGEFARLEGTAAEVGAVSDLWRRGRNRREPAQVLTGSEASENTAYADMTGKRVVHLATHGFFANEECRTGLEGSEPGAVGLNPMLLSGVVFASANADHDILDYEDGILTAEELSAIDLRGTELVVLSACETGLGVVRAGEGVLGLRRAFAAAGAENLVMSLWAVPDRETSELMEAFYVRVLHRRKPMTPGDAMREAQLEMLEHNRQEYDEARPGSWAAFVVAGAP